MDAVRAVAQRVSSAQVSVAGEVIGRIDGPGLMVLVGVTHTDTEQLAAKLAAKLWQLRIMPDEQSCADLDAPLLVVASSPSTPTRARDAVRPGRRPRPARSANRWWSASSKNCARSVPPSRPDDLAPTWRCRW